ncbi:uncharacterized protein LOC142177335 [Nicotiana tabacum]|uniref:Uncharacterized protein LOC142177335 n=1 Tax=Nicotiana tabacum TaxID=4097 RepID=A0AC58TXH9_TOBAC
MAPIEALYGQRRRSPIGWFEPTQVGLLGPDLVHDALEKVALIQQRLKIAQRRQKIYTYVHRCKLEFKEDDQVLLKVSPIKDVMRFAKKGKLSPRFIGPYLILKRIGEVAYKLELPASMTLVHPVFHVSMLRGYVPDPAHIVSPEVVEINDGLTYDEEPVEILDRQVHRLRTKYMALVKAMYWCLEIYEVADAFIEVDVMRRAMCGLLYCILIARCEVGILG